MKCYKCNGTGYYDIDNECPICDGTGEYEPFDEDVELDKLYPTELTNEEWLHAMNTEQLTEFLSRVFWARTFCEVCDVKICKISNGCKYGNKPYRECWKEWLKQPHTTKE